MISSGSGSHPLNNGLNQDDDSALSKPLLNMAASTVMDTADAASAAVNPSLLPGPATTARFSA